MIIELGFGFEDLLIYFLEEVEGAVMPCDAIFAVGLVVLGRSEGDDIGGEWLVR